MRSLMFAATALLVAGCYESNEMLLDPGQARQPIAAVKDWTFGAGKERVHARLMPRPDGWYDYAEAHFDAKGGEEGWKTWRVVLNPLTSAGGYEVFVYGTYNKDDGAYMYGVVAVGAAGFWQAVTPNCNPFNADPKWRASDVALAKASGAKMKAFDDVADVCHFTTRQELLAAMRSVVAAPGFLDRIKTERGN